MGFWSELMGIVESNGTEDEKSPADIIERLCRKLDWEVDERRGDRIRLHFKGDGLVERRTVSIGCHEKLCTFLTLSMSTLYARDIPGDLPAAILRHNGECVIGAWEMDVDDDGEVNFMCSYAIPAKVLTPKFFKTICTSLVAEASDFDRRLAEHGLFR
jgi:hypothetical protein